MDIFMHGRYFGNDGKLSHIAVTVASQNTTFLLDVVSLGEEALTIDHRLNFKAVLEDPSIKVCTFDARRDAQALRRLGIRLKGVVDLKAFQNAPLLPLTPDEMSEKDKQVTIFIVSKSSFTSETFSMKQSLTRLRVVLSAAAVVNKHGIGNYAQKPLSPEARHSWHHFLAFFVGFFPRYYALRLQILQQLGELPCKHGWTERLRQILEKCSAHEDWKGEIIDYPRGDWNFFLGLHCSNIIPTETCIRVCPKQKDIIVETRSVNS